MNGRLQVGECALTVRTSELRIGEAPGVFGRCGRLQVGGCELQVRGCALRICPEGVAPPLPAPDTDAVFANWVLSVPELGTNIWTGQGTLTLDGTDYMGAPGILEVSGFGSSPDNDEETASLSLLLPSVEMRLQFLRDFGPKRCILSQVYSKDFGITWHRIPRRFVGRLSGPTVADDRYSITIVSRKYDVDRGEALHWPLFPELQSRRVLWPPPR